MANLGELLGGKTVAEAVLDEKLFAAELTKGLAEKVAPALQPVLKAFVDHAAEVIPAAVATATAPLLAEVAALRADLRAAVEQFDPDGLTVTVGRKAEGA